MLVLPLLLFRTPTACAHRSTLGTRLAHAGTLAWSLTHAGTVSRALAHARSLALALSLTHTCAPALTHALTAAIALAHAAGALATTRLRHCDTTAQRSHQDRNHQNLLMHSHPFLEINKTQTKV
jgi:hypothetical protein